MISVAADFLLKDEGSKGERTEFIALLIYPLFYS